MTAVIILNIVLAVFVVGGILALLGWGILSDRVVATRLTERRRTAPRRQPAPRSPAYSRGPAYNR